MADSNFINLTFLQRAKKIYRVMPISRMIEMFAERQNVLTKPRLWDDPYENFIMRGRGRLADGQIVDYGMRDSLYGQCWTLCRESDAMWRIYSPQSSGVKIRTTIEKLFSSLCNIVPDQSRDVSCFIGKVKYLKREDIERYIENGLYLDGTGTGVVETLLIKRMAFSHEKEVRLIYWAEERDARSEIFQYQIDPHNLIEEVVFDSRLDANSFRIYRDHLRAINFNGTIVHSGLYRSPGPIITRVK